MASLKEIMNMEEEGHGPESVKRKNDSVPRSSGASIEAISTSRHDSPTDTPYFSPLAQETSNETSSLAQPTPDSATNISSSASSTGSRRRSNNSNGPMDAAYYPGPHAYSALSPADTSSRAHMISGGLGNEGNVRLTPITGRPSRAMKGLPVHTCDQCRPPKTFSRAEHLRRHQLSHQPPDFPCLVPGCDKAFHRKDLLERHQLKHEQDSRVGEISSRSGGTSSDGSGSPFLGGPTSNPGYPPLVSSSMAGPGRGSALGLGIPDSDVSMTTASWSSIGDPSHLSGPHGEVPGNYRMGAVFSSGSADLVNGYISPSSNDQWHTDTTLPPSTAMSATNSAAAAFSIPPNLRGSSAGNWNDTVTPLSAAQRGVQSPMMDSSTGFYTYAATSPQVGASTAYGSTLGLPLNGYTGAESLQSSGDLLNNTTVRSLLPPLAMAQSSETLVTNTPTLLPDRVASQLNFGRPEDPLSPVGSQLAAAMALDHELQSMIPAYIEVYWDKVHSIYPIVHQSTFDGEPDIPANQKELLRCSMAAVATQFLEDKQHRIYGNKMHTYVWETVKAFTQTDEWPTSVMQTVLLSEYYARFRGRRKESHRPSARFAKLYQMAINRQNTFSPIPDTGDKLWSWKQWIDVEARRRILSGCFVLDVHSMLYYEQPPMVIRNLDYSSPACLPIPLCAGSIKMWEASDHQSWGQLARVAPALQTVSTVLSKAITSDDIASAAPMDAAILLGACALYLPRRRNMTHVESVVSLNAPQCTMADIFPTSGIASTYLALHYTPLHVLLSVSGESWVFNKKVLRATMYSEHRQYLDEWSRTDEAVAGAWFAAKALKAFIGLTPETLEFGSSAFVEQNRGAPWKDISDFWGVYVCALICWAYGQGGKRKIKDNDASRLAGIQWILAASSKGATEFKDWDMGRSTLAVVCLARDILNQDCVGGRNILFADAVNVLKKLGGRDNWDWPSRRNSAS